MPQDLQLELTLVNRMERDLKQAEGQINKFGKTVETGFKKMGRTASRTFSKDFLSSFTNTSERFAGIMGEKIVRPTESGFQKIGDKAKAVFERDITGAVLKTTIAFGALTAAGIGALKIFESVGKVQDLTRGFENLSKSVGTTSEVLINDLQAGFRGAISQMELMQQANNALLLGIPLTGENAKTLAEGARRLAKALGKDAAFGFESLVTGIGRQSRLMLDNLGIVVKSEQAYKDLAQSLGKTVSALTEQEKKLAFFNATMDAVRDKLSKLGKDELTLSEATNQLTSGFSNLASAGALELAQALDNVGFVKFISDVGLGAQELVRARSEAEGLAQSINLLNIELSLLKQAQDGTIASFSDYERVKQIFNELHVSFGDFNSAIELTEKNLEGANKALDKINFQKQFIERIGGQKAFIDLAEVVFFTGNIFDSISASKIKEQTATFRKAVEQSIREQEFNFEISNLRFQFEKLDDVGKQAILNFGVFATRELAIAIGEGLERGIERAKDLKIEFNAIKAEFEKLEDVGKQVFANIAAFAGKQSLEIAKGIQEGIKLNPEDAISEAFFEFKERFGTLTEFEEIAKARLEIVKAADELAEKLGIEKDSLLIQKLTTEAIKQQTEEIRKAREESDKSKDSFDSLSKSFKPRSPGGVSKEFKDRFLGGFGQGVQDLREFRFAQDLTLPGEAKPGLEDFGKRLQDNQGLLDRQVKGAQQGQDQLAKDFPGIFGEGGGQGGVGGLGTGSGGKEGAGGSKVVTEIKKLEQEFKKERQLLQKALESMNQATKANMDLHKTNADLHNTAVDKLTEHNGTLKDHEGRITALENSGGG